MTDIFLEKRIHCRYTIENMTEQQRLPKPFVWRRWHSLTGIWLSIFLIEHLLTNSQAALWLGGDGSGFIHAVNFIKHLPYLEVIEILLLGVPIFIHLVWGIQYLRTGKLNSFPTDGTTPSLTQYPRNHAYSWQRITSWILVATLLGHIIHMRFLEYPYSAKVNGKNLYMVRVNLDEGLYTLAGRLNVQLYDQQMIDMQKQQLPAADNALTLSSGMWSSFVDSLQGIFTQQKEKQTIMRNKREELLIQQNKTQQKHFLHSLESRTLAPGQVIAVTEEFGIAELLMVRETFKMPMMIALYTIFVLSACYHGFNGLWTFLITWGVSLTARSQQIMRSVSTTLMVVVAFLGLAAIWGTYWINLKS
ncbi:MAG: succinate dehydrogenase [Waddliaceae bacterium]